MPDDFDRDRRNDDRDRDRDSDRDRDRMRNSRDRDDDDYGRSRRNRDRDDDYDDDRGYDDFDRRSRRRDYQDSNLTAGEWLVAILCSGIGCIIGIVWLISGNPKGGKMLGFSILFDIIKSAIYLAATGGKGLQ